MWLELSYTPHEGQRLFHESKARFKILDCGRRWGKTLAVSADGIKYALSAPNPRKWRGWMVAPTWDIGRETWRAAHDILRPHWQRLVDRDNQTDHTIYFKNHAELTWRSADKPGSLVGAGLDWLCIDEAARVKEESWDTVQPCISEKQGRVVLVSTPKGHNWFEQMWQRGQDPGYPDYESWKAPSNTNPYFPAEEWERARAENPEIVFLQEFQAEFIADAGLVFRKIGQACGGKLMPPVPTHHYVMGVDLARMTDFTVMCVMDCSMPKPQVVAWDRFNTVDWVIQAQRITRMAQAYGAPIWLDTTGIGDVIYEALRGAGLEVVPFLFSNQSKRNLVNRLVVGMDEEALMFPTIPELIAELRAYQYELLPSGNLRYSAPSRAHDDCVVALALAYWGATGGEFYRLLTLEDLDEDYRRVKIAAY